MCYVATYPSPRAGRSLLCGGLCVFNALRSSEDRALTEAKEKGTGEELRLMRN